MDYRRAPKSRHFEDRTAQSQFEGELRFFLDPDLAPGPIQFGDGPPGGYAHWLQDRLQHLSPDEAADLKRGLPIEDILRIKAMLNGKIKPDVDRLRPRTLDEWLQQ